MSKNINFKNDSWKRRQQPGNERTESSKLLSAGSSSTVNILFPNLRNFTRSGEEGSPAKSAINQRVYLSPRTRHKLKFTQNFLPWADSMGFSF